MENEMKKKFFSIAKSHNVEITDYKSERSDMGVQMFKMRLKFTNGVDMWHYDGYHVGEGQGREKVIAVFEECLLDAVKQPCT